MSVETIRDVFEKHMPAQITTHAQTVEKIGASYKFVVTGDEAATWMLDFTKSADHVEEGDRDAECTITVSDEVLKAIVNGKQNAQMAMMTGKLKIAGNMGLALKLNALL